MVVLDSFPFEEGGDVQYLGGVRHSEHVAAGLRRRTEICFSSAEASLADSGNYSSTTIYENCERLESGEGCHEYIQFTPSQGYIEGAENSQGYMKCRLCPYQTKIESLLRRHVVKHSLDSDFQCPACDFRENDASKFVDHIHTHQSGKLVRCCFCPKKMTRAKLKSHVRIHRAVDLYDCSMCQFSTNYEKTIKSHMDVYHTKVHSCQQCGQIMTKHDLHWHMKFVHSMEPMEMLLEKVIPLPVPAGRGSNSETPEIPDKIIPTQSNSILPRKFGTKVSRKTSLALKIQKNIVAKKQFNCGKCEYKTQFKKLLRTHRSKHLLDNSLVCTKCGFKETGPGKFATHLVLHSPNDLFECCFCGFQTPTRGTMSNHVSKHKPVPMFDCSECEFSARRPASVRTHMKRRHGKRLQCKSCGLEMSRFAMVSHKQECRALNVPDSGACPPSASLETEHYETATEPDVPQNTRSNIQPDENTVACEFCKKPYAKSYVRKHAKKCILEHGPDPGSSKSREDGSVSPVSQLIQITLTSDATAVLNPIVTGNHLEAGTSREVLIAKAMSLNKPKKPHLRCNSCSFKTRKKTLLKKHVVKHLIDFRLTCPECGHKEMSSFKFAHHVMQHGSDPEIFQCCFCSLSAPTSKRSYCAHLDLHRPVNIFDCPKCEYSSNRADCVRNHCKSNHSKNRRCPHCGQFMSKARLLKHLLECHGGVKDGNIKLDKTEDAASYEASCASSHRARTKLGDFNLDNSGGQGQSNTDGDLQDSFETSQMVQADHSETPNPHEIEVPLVKTELEFLKCTKCSFKTKIQSLMDRHIAKHLVDVPFVCPLCGFEHLSSRKFANHWDKHECNAKKKVYQCCFCSAEVKKKNCLKAFLPQHIEEHRRVALQDCSECEFSSHSRYELEKHNKNQHVKKCTCLLCGEVMSIFDYSSHTECKSGDMAEDAGTMNCVDYESVDFSTLRRRSSEVQDSLIAALEDPASLLDAELSAVTDGLSKTAHPGSRPSSVTLQIMYCSTCDYSTKLKYLLERHVLKHLIDIPFSCKLCSFSSFDERMFADHIFTHTGSYKCIFCRYRAGNYTVAARHYSSHKALAMNDCPKCEFTSTYKYRLIEHLRGRHVDVPRCSYCGKKMLKDELNSHETECSGSLRSMGRFQSSGTVQMAKDGLTMDDTSPRALAEYCRAVSNQDSCLYDQQVSQVPTHESPSSDTKSFQRVDGIQSQGFAHHSAEIHSHLAPILRHVVSAAETCLISNKDVAGATHESIAVADSPGQEPGLADPVCLASLAKFSTPVDHVPPMIQESNDTSVTLSHNTNCLNSVTDTFPCGDEAQEVIQESKSVAALSSQEPGLKPSVGLTSSAHHDVQTWQQDSSSADVLSSQAPVFLASLTEIYTHADGVPLLPGKSNSAAILSSQVQDKGLKASFGLTSSANDVPIVIGKSNSGPFLPSLVPGTKDTVFNTCSGGPES